jgi:hypothetical protein
MARVIRILVASVLLLPLGVPAVAHEEAEPGECRLIRGANTPDDPTDDVHVCRQDVFFHQAENKFGNAAALDQDDFPSFDNVKPDESVTTGAGGGYLGSSATHQNGEPFDPKLTATFDGTFTGDMDNLAVTMYMFNPPEDAQALPTFAVNSRLIVDGEEIAVAGGAEVKRSPGGDAVFRIDFAFVNIYSTLEAFGLNGHDREHQIRFQVQGTGLGTEAALFVYDTSEVPSGMIFNLEPEHLGSYTVAG